MDELNIPGEPKPLKLVSPVSPKVQKYIDQFEDFVENAPPELKVHLQLNKAAKKIGRGINEILDLWEGLHRAGKPTTAHGSDENYDKLEWLNSAMARVLCEHTAEEHHATVEEFLDQFTNE